jgi:cytochrome-b5 reductase
MSHLIKHIRPIHFFRYFSIMAVSSDLPSSLTGNPECALVLPGICQFTPEFTSVPLLERWQISPTSSVLRFGLPDPSHPLNLSTCACILAKADIPDTDGVMEPVIRPYTPISTNTQIGSFDLLVKDYGESGRMSNYLCKMKKGQEIAFKHIDFNVKMQAPFPFKTVSMLVGGTGITPMIQALHAILGDQSCEAKVIVLYGSRVSSDILGKELLDSWCDKFSRLEVVHVLSHEPDDSSWTGARGHISKEMIAKFFPDPKDSDNIIFICGPPPMYDVFSGPRDQKELSGVLDEMGYKAEQVYKF